VLLLSGGALAQSSTETRAARSSSLDQEVDIPRENTLAALVLGVDDIEDIANIHRAVSQESEFEREVDLDEDDVLAALVLSRGGFDGFGWDGRHGTRAVLLDDDRWRDDFGRRVVIVDDGWRDRFDGRVRIVDRDFDDHDRLSWMDARHRHDVDLDEEDILLWQLLH
jgi:hypothetical protein